MGVPLRVGNILMALLRMWNRLGVLVVLVPAQFTFIRCRGILLKGTLLFIVKAADL